MSEARRRLRSLSVNDETCVENVLGIYLENAEASGLDRKTYALVRLAALLALDSASVRRGSLAAGFIEPTDDPQSLFYPRLQLHAPSGVVGDPTLASAALGLRYLERWVDILVAAYRGEKNVMYANATQKP